VIDDAIYKVASRGWGNRGIGMNYRHMTFAAALTVTALSALAPANAGEMRAVIELFTSQGCSSCPAADRLAGELAHDPTLLVMSLPIDYWDYLGWKDTLALHGNTKRQRSYAEARGDREVYTPQVVINGVAHALGSDKTAINNAINQTRQRVKPLTVPITLNVADGKVTVTLPTDADGQRSGEVWLCPISGKVPVTIERGENRGRIVTYYNVVRRWVKLGDWNGKAESFSVAVGDILVGKLTLSDIDRLAVIVQSGAPAKPGVMLGAAVAGLR
jgi:hypothetical protein